MSVQLNFDDDIENQNSYNNYNEFENSLQHNLDNYDEWENSQPLLLEDLIVESKEDLIRKNWDKKDDPKRYKIVNINDIGDKNVNCFSKFLKTYCDKSKDSFCHEFILINGHGNILGEKKEGESKLETAYLVDGIPSNVRLLYQGIIGSIVCAIADGPLIDFFDMCYNYGTQNKLGLGKFLQLRAPYHEIIFRGDKHEKWGYISRIKFTKNADNTSYFESFTLLDNDEIDNIVENNDGYNMNIGTSLSSIIRIISNYKPDTKFTFIISSCSIPANIVFDTRNELNIVEFPAKPKLYKGLSSYKDTKKYIRNQLSQTPVRDNDNRNNLYKYQNISDIPKILPYKSSFSTRSKKYGGKYKRSVKFIKSIKKKQLKIKKSIRKKQKYTKKNDLKKRISIT
jgi:hypothetical protein